MILLAAMLKGFVERGSTGMFSRNRNSLTVRCHCTGSMFAKSLRT